MDGIEERARLRARVFSRRGCAQVRANADVAATCLHLCLDVCI